MPVLSLVYFRNLSLLSETCKAKCLDVAAASLRDANQEVREMASSYVPLISPFDSGFLGVKLIDQDLEWILAMLAASYGCCAKRPLHSGDQGDDFAEKEGSAWADRP